jgi:hypothetical protein
VGPIEVKGKQIIPQDGIAKEMWNDKEFIEGIRRGVKACKEGKIRPWADVKRDLGIK